MSVSCGELVSLSSPVTPVFNIGSRTPDTMCSTSGIVDLWIRLTVYFVRQYATNERITMDRKYFKSRKQYRCQCNICKMH